MALRNLLQMSLGLRKGTHTWGNTSTSTTRVSCNTSQASCVVRSANAAVVVEEIGLGMVVEPTIVSTTGSDTYAQGNLSYQFNNKLTH